jgi:OmpA-OmpF porin, OOP family
LTIFYYFEQSNLTNITVNICNFLNNTMKKIMCLMLLFSASFSLKAQINLEEKVRNQTRNRVDQKADEGVSEGLDAMEDGVKSLFKKKERNKVEVNKEPIEQPGIPEQTSVPTQKSQTPPQENPSASLASFTKYDFVPGDQVLLFEDFSQDAVGDFPALWTTDGSGEIRTTNLFPGKFLYMNARDRVYNLMKDLMLPQNYIIEFDVIPTSESEDGSSTCSFYMTLYDSKEDFLNNDLLPGDVGLHISMGTFGWEVTPYKEGEYGIRGETALVPIDPNKLNHIIIWVQNRRMRVYHKGQKALDLPTIIPANAKFNRLRYSLWSQEGLPYLTNLRITTAAPDMRSKLLTEGKLVSYGIYFDVNSDKVKPESYGSLKQIADVLNENPAVKINIIGHTDSDGDDNKNLDLSKRRSAAVKKELNNSFNIAENRIHTDGKGETEPLQENNTAEGKAKNRRVEFIKQ